MYDNLISFVIPCYRSENTIKDVVSEVISVVEKQGEKYDYEFILVNDCSPDNVWSVINTLAIENQKIKGVNLAKNFGQQAAILAGMAQTKGSYVFCLDDDGQAPIDATFELIKKLDEGYDVVYAKYHEVKQNLFRRFGSDVSKKMSQICIGIPKDIRVTSFFVLKRLIVDEIVKYKNPYAFLSGLIFRTTRKVTCVETNHRERKEGKSGYTLKKLLSLWMNGFTAFSIKPLQISTYLGVFFAFVGFVYAIIVFLQKLLGYITSVGWASVVCLLLIIGGMIMVMLGLIGEYLGRIYICMNKSPQYVIRNTINIEEKI